MKLEALIAAWLFSFSLTASAACPFDPNCLNNPYGAGSPYSSESINNPFGAGNPYSNVKLYVVPEV